MWPVSETLLWEWPVAETLLWEWPVSETLFWEWPVAKTLLWEWPVAETLLWEWPVAETLLWEWPVAKTLLWEWPCSSWNPPQRVTSSWYPPLRVTSSWNPPLRVTSSWNLPLRKGVKASCKWQQWQAAYVKEPLKDPSPATDRNKHLHSLVRQTACHPHPAVTSRGGVFLCRGGKMAPVVPEIITINLKPATVAVKRIFINKGMGNCREKLSVTLQWGIHLL